MSKHKITDYIGTDRPLVLTCGDRLSHFVLAYETYGQLNDKRDNAILVCHALSGDQYVASPNPETDRPGWWSTMVGPDKPINTNDFYVICSNVLGGCMDSTGPSSIIQETGKRWGASFPMITISDMVNAQALLIDFLGIETLYAVVGGSMGGMQALEWLRLFPHRMRGAAVLATSSRQSAQGIAFHEVGRQAIMSDPEWREGSYLEQNTFPVNGLSVARMIAHITYLSHEKFNEKFGRQLQSKNFKSYSWDSDFQVESYLNHQGMTFTKRFDPNSYLYLTKAIDYFDQAEDEGGVLSEEYKRVFSQHKPKVYLASFSSDWAYPASESTYVESALREAEIQVRHNTITTNAGHDAFLLPNPELERDILCFLNQTLKS